MEIMERDLGDVAKVVRNQGCAQPRLCAAKVACIKGYAQLKLMALARRRPAIKKTKVSIMDIVKR